jgi:hypothetical protein
MDLYLFYVNTINAYSIVKAKSFLLLAIQNLKDHNIHAVVGPFDVPISLATESLNITYLAASEVKTRFTNSTFQMIPRLNDFSQALLDMVKRYGWSEVSIFFDDSKGKICTKLPLCLTIFT